MEILTIYETNIFRDSGSEYLILIRAIFVAIMSWMIYEEIHLKGRLQLEKFTIWGELGTFTVFLLLMLCSIEKYHKHLKYDEEQQSNSRNIWLYRSTAVLFQVIFISELVLCTYFWIYIWVMATDVHKMTS